MGIGNGFEVWNFAVCLTVTIGVVVAIAKRIQRLNPVAQFVRKPNQEKLIIIKQALKRRDQSKEVELEPVGEKRRSTREAKIIPNT